MIVTTVTMAVCHVDMQTYLLLLWSVAEFDYPCGSQIVALRGYDREKLWQTHVRGSPLFVDCQNLDVNADGKVDCIITGRGASVQAVDRATG